MKRLIITVAVFAVVFCGGGVARAMETAPVVREAEEVAALATAHYNTIIEALGNRDGYAALAGFEKLDSIKAEITGPLLPAMRALAHKMAAKADLREIDRLQEYADALMFSASQYMAEYKGTNPEKLIEAEANLQEIETLDGRVGTLIRSAKQHIAEYEKYKPNLDELVK